MVSKPKRLVYVLINNSGVEDPLHNLHYKLH
jgi:hypothetical protein